MQFLIRQSLCLLILKHITSTAKQSSLPAIKQGYTVVSKISLKGNCILCWNLYNHKGKTFNPAIVTIPGNVLKPIMD